MAYKNETDLKRSALDVIGFMETSLPYPQYYQKIAGNFDGAGLSYGVFQWNFVTENLQPILQGLITNYQDVVKTAFGFSADPSYYNTLVTVISTYTTAEQIAWGDSISDPTNKHNVIEPWKTYFNNLGATTECQNAQVTAMSSYFTTATTFFNTYKALTPETYGSQRFYTLMLDQSVNSGGILSEDVTSITNDFAKINTINKTQEEIEIEKMLIFSKYAPRNKTQEFYTFLAGRRRTIADGEGYINGVYINMLEDFDISMEVAFPSSAPSTKPRLSKNLNNDLNFESSPKIRGSELVVTRPSKITTICDSSWKFKKGIKLESTDIIKAGNNDATTQYVRLARIRSSETEISSYGRLLLRGELIHSSSNPKMATLEMYLADNTTGGIGASSTFNIINSGRLGYVFGTGDVFYQHLDPVTGTNLYVDIWVKLLSYSQLSFNVTGLVCDNGMSIEFDPIDKTKIVSAIPLSGTTTYVSYGRKGENYPNRVNCNVQTAVDFNYYTITTT